MVVRHSWQCFPVYIKTINNNNKKKTSFSRFPFLAHTVIIFSLSYFKRIPFLTGKKIKRNAPREIRTYLLYATSPAPKPLHHSGRHCRNATNIRHSVSNNLIISVYSAKTTGNRSEMKLAYATPFELQGQKNTTIHVVYLFERYFSFYDIRDTWTVCACSRFYYLQIAQWIYS